MEELVSRQRLMMHASSESRDNEPGYDGPRRHRLACDRGFTLIEVVVAAAILAVLSAVMFPVVADQVERRRVDNAITTLKELADATTAFRVGVALNPGRLTQLTTPITTSDVNSCGLPYAAAAVTAWANTGPYYTRQLLISTGLPLSEDNVGRVQDVLIRAPSGTTLAFQITGAPLDKVTEIDASVDGDGGATTGRVRWLPTVADANGQTTMFYHVAINGC